MRLLARRGVRGSYADGGDDHDNENPVETAEPALARLLGASAKGVVAMGPNAGAPVRRLGRNRRGRSRQSQKPLHGHLDGFDLHAGIAVDAADRDGLERLARYLLRPSVAQERLSLLSDGRVTVELKSAWNDGTTHLLFEPLELLARIASFVPRPRSNLILYHGVFAANATWRSSIVAHLPARCDDPAAAHKDEKLSCASADVGGDDNQREPTPSRSRPNYGWRDLMRRAFGIDPLLCPRCATPMKLVAVIESPCVIRAILKHVGPPTEPRELCPARASPDYSDDAAAAGLWN